MSTIIWPSAIIPSGIQAGIKANTQVFVSDLNGSVQTVELPGARWTFEIDLPVLERADARLMEAFIAKLRGQANRAEIPFYGRLVPVGTWAGTPRVNNEAGSPTLSQNGTTLVCDGFTAGAIIKAGDYFNLGTGGQLLMVTDDVTADGSGNATLSVQPPIRTAPADNTLLVSTSPVLPTAIMDDPHARWNIKPSGTPNDGHSQFRLSFTEVFE